MKIIQFFDSKIKNLRSYDISLIKITTVAITLAIAKLFPVILSLDLSVYLIIAAIAAIRPLYVMFKKD